MLCWHFLFRFKKGDDDNDIVGCIASRHFHATCSECESWQKWTKNQQLFIESFILAKEWWWFCMVIIQTTKYHMVENSKRLVSMYRCIIYKTFITANNKQLGKVACTFSQTFTNRSVLRACFATVFDWINISAREYLKHCFQWLSKKEKWEDWNHCKENNATNSFIDNGNKKDWDKL